MVSSLGLPSVVAAVCPEVAAGNHAQFHFVLVVLLFLLSQGKGKHTPQQPGSPQMA